MSSRKPTSVALSRSAFITPLSITVAEPWLAPVGDRSVKAASRTSGSFDTGTLEESIGKLPVSAT